jgi:uncharacterized membrane protein
MVGINNNCNTGGGLSSGAIAGIVIGSLFFVAIIAIIIACFLSVRSSFFCLFNE